MTPARTRHPAAVHVLAAAGLTVTLVACGQSGDDATDDLASASTPTAAASTTEGDPAATAEPSTTSEAPSGTPPDGGTDSDDSDDTDSDMGSEAGGTGSEVAPAVEDDGGPEDPVFLDGDLPENFPSDIPLPRDAEVLAATSMDDGDDVGFSVAFQPADAIDAVADDLVTRFEDAGYTVDDIGEMTSGDVVSHPLRFDGPDWAGTVIIGDNADGTIAVYTVTAPSG